MTWNYGRRCFVWSLLALLVSQATFAQSNSGEAPPQEAAVYWVFLTSGKSIQGTDRTEIESMQAAHLANFRRLHNEGKLYTAGPMADPHNKMRGIVVVTAPDLKSLPELFEPDPFLKHGYMTIDAIKMEIAVGKFQRNVDPKALAEYRLVLLEKSTPDGHEVDAGAQSKNLEYCQSIHDAERLCFAGWLSEDKSSRRGILIFRKLDDGLLKSLVDELPAVKSKTWKATTFPLYMTEGIVN
jgi:uncharacterized protein YciI